MTYRLPPLSRHIRTLNDQESLRLDALHQGGLRGPANCVTCGGTGTYRWYGPDGPPVVWECDCVDQCIAYRYFWYSNIPDHYQRLSWLDATDVEPDAVHLAHSYLTDAHGYVSRGMGIVYHGTFGTGKTLLAVLILKGMLSLGYTGYFTTFSEMKTQFSEAWRDPEERRWFYRRVKNVDVLVIDDVGKEYKGKQALSEAVFDDVLRHRVMANKPTIITTNNTLDELAAGYGTNVFSLLDEKMVTQHLVGQDFRKSAYARSAAELVASLTRPVVVG